MFCTVCASCCSNEWSDLIGRSGVGASFRGPRSWSTHYGMRLAFFDGLKASRGGLRFSTTLWLGSDGKRGVSGGRGRSTRF